MEQIDKLERFFELDLKAKNIIEKARPNLYDIDPVVEEKKMINSINQIEIITNEMLSYFYGVYKDKVYDKLELIKDSIQKCNLKTRELLKTYEQYFLIMDDDLLELLEKTSRAYSLKFGQPKVVEKCKSVNELLHSLHFFVLNDEKIMQSMNVLDTKITENHKKVTLYGKENETARAIFNIFNDDVSDYTDIISFKDHILMMVRDRGHALTMDIQSEGDNFRVLYFIPKICNNQMINNLPGIKKVPDNATNYDQAKGEFVAKKEKISNVINDFISMVPTDMDNPDIMNSFENDLPHIKI